MKNLTKVLAIAAVGLFLVAGSASALSFDFAGGFTLSDLAGDDNFAETLNLNASKVTPGKSVIQMADPDFDSVLNAGSYVTFSAFTLDSSLYTSGLSYNFASNPYVDGFKVYNSSGNLLMDADIALSPLTVDGGTGHINSNFSLNLTDIRIYVEGSPILDAFVPYGGATDFTLNIAGANLAGMIENGGGKGSYSGSAAPVPEPATIFLLGSGLVGLGVIKRKKKTA